MRFEANGSFLLRENVSALSREREIHMENFKLDRAFTLIEPGPVLFVTTNDGQKNNVMTISWSIVLDFAANFALVTGPWNFSYAALEKTKECVLALPTADMIDTVVGVGTCSGRDTDKFQKFGLTPLTAKHVQAPLVKECLANIECRVVDIIARYNIIILEGLAAYVDPSHKDKRLLHAVGDGTFTVDSQIIDKREAMRSKLPDGV